MSNNQMSENREGSRTKYRNRSLAPDVIRHRMKRSSLHVLVALSATLTLLSSGCRIGAVPLAPIDAVTYPGFAPDSITQLTVSRAFPGETPWTLRLRRVPNVPTDREWVIDGAPTPVSDHLGNGNFIRHLIETLATLQAVETPADDLPERFGLKPERARLEWQGTGAPGILLIGETIGGTRRYGKFRADAGSQVFAGAALQMIEVPPRWEALREPRLFLRPLDDYDIVRVTTGERDSTFERLGTEWRRGVRTTAEVKGATREKTAKSRAPTPFESELPGELDRLFHFRIRNFIDDVGLQTTMLHASEDTESTLATLRLRDRADAETTLRVFRMNAGTGDAILFRTSEREGIVFEAYPELLGLVNTLASASTPSPANQISKIKK